MHLQRPGLAHAQRWPSPRSQSGTCLSRWACKRHGRHRHQLLSSIARLLDVHAAAAGQHRTCWHQEPLAAQGM